MDGSLITLRPITGADTPDILRWRNAPHVMAQFLRRTPLTEAEHTRWLREQVEPGHTAQRIVIEKATGQAVGSVYIQHIDRAHRSGEFGIFIGAPEATGKGLGLEATRLMTRYAFETLGLHRVFLRVLPENLAAIRVYEKAGYVREGLFRDDVRIDGVFRDVAFMAARARSAGTHLRREEGGVDTASHEAAGSARTHLRREGSGVDSASHEYIAPYSEGESPKSPQTTSELEAGTARRLRLRPITEADTPNILRWRNSDLVRHNYADQRPLTREIHTRWLREQVETGQVAQFIIVERDTGRDVGSAFLKGIDRDNSKAEFGIFLGEEASLGKGLGGETARLMLAYGLETLGLHRIFSRVFTDNTASLRMCERAGMVREGLFRDYAWVDGEWRDMVFLAVLAVPAPDSEGE